MTFTESDLARRATLAGLETRPALLRQATRFLALLFHWNRRINLTSHQGPDDAIDRLIIEPLMAARHVSPACASFLDIGSGGGSPAVPLKLARPDLALVMVERRRRKVAFLREAVRELALTDVRVECGPFESLAADPGLAHRVDLVTMRAVRAGRREIEVLQELLQPRGQLFWFRGKRDVLPAESPSLTFVGDYPLVPSLESRLLVLQKGR